MKLRLRKLKGYKYDVDTPYYERDTDLPRQFKFSHPYFSLEAGRVRAEKHYAYDGASGPTWDDKTNRKASLIHDICYQAMRLSLLGRGHRKAIDQTFRRHCIEDGMSKFRAWYYYNAVRIFGARTCKPEKNPRGKIITI